MWGRLRRFDVQADFAIATAFVAALPCLAALGLAFRNFQREWGQIVYGAKGFFLPAFLGCLVLSILLGAVAFALGLNSAGHRRNDKQARSWAGFFVGGTVLTADLILLIAFFMLRFESPM